MPGDTINTEVCVHCVRTMPRNEVCHSGDEAAKCSNNSLSDARRGQDSKESFLGEIDPGVVSRR